MNNTYTTIEASLDLARGDYEIRLNVKEWLTGAGVAGHLLFTKDGKPENHVIGLYQRPKQWIAEMKERRRNKSKTFSYGPHALVFRDGNIHSLYIEKEVVDGWEDLDEKNDFIFSKELRYDNITSRKILLTHKQ